MSANAQIACLTVKSALGHVFVVALEPPNLQFSGDAPLSSCSASTVQKLTPVNG